MVHSTIHNTAHSRPMYNLDDKHPTRKGFEPRATIGSNKPSGPAYVICHPVNAIHIGSVVVHIGPVMAHIGPVVAHICPVLAHIGPVVAHIGPVVAHISPVVVYIGPW